jgi:hypothetical protein
MSQKSFIESVAPAFGHDTSRRPPERISIEVKFFTFNKANDTSFMVDSVLLTIISSNEDATTLCEGDLANLAIDPASSMIP